MTPLLIQATALIACAIIVARAEPALNRMGKSTPILIRLSIHLLAVGALSEIGCILFSGEVPNWPTVIISIGIAALLVCERRLRVLCPVTRHKAIAGRGRGDA